MYEFPPPIWMNQDLTPAGILSIIFFGVVIPIFAAKRSRPHVWVVVAWFLSVATVWYADSLWWHGSQQTVAPYRYMIALPIAVTVIGCVAMYRILEQSRGVVAFCYGVLVLFCFSSAAVLFLLPTVESRPVSHRTWCKNNLKQIGLALHNYHDQSHRFPPAALGQHKVSWRVTLLPFVEQESLAQRYDSTQSWTSPTNAPLSKINVPQYACPSRPKSFNSDGQFLASYIAPTCPGAVFASDTGAEISEIKDGTSNTLLIVEACGTSIVWSSPRDVELSAAEISVNGPSKAKGLSNSLTSSWHKGGAQVLLADGSARFLSTETDESLLRALITQDGGEKVPEW